MSLVGKTFASYFKDLFHINNSNSGVDATVRNVKDGLGNSTAISLSDDSLTVQPIDDDSPSAFIVKNKAGNNIFFVSTSDSAVKVGASNVNATTMYANFGTSYLDTTGSASFAADTHYAVGFAGANSFGSAAANVAMGTSTTSSFNDTNPATSLTISNTAMDMVGVYWYVMDDITIDAVKWWHAADAATGEATAAHLMAYTVDSANGSTSGDLSSGVVVADGANITNAGYEQAYYQAMTIQSANVDAGKVILFTFASDTVNSDYSINATVKYHIR